VLGVHRSHYTNPLQNPVRKEKRDKIILIKAEISVNNGIMDKISNAKQGIFSLFNLCNRFFKGFYTFKINITAS